MTARGSAFASPVWDFWGSSSSPLNLSGSTTVVFSGHLLFPVHFAGTTTVTFGGDSTFYDFLLPLSGTCVITFSEAERKCLVGFVPIQ